MIQGWKLQQVINTYFFHIPHHTYSYCRAKPTIIKNTNGSDNSLQQFVSFFLFLTTAWGFSSSKLCLEETVNSDQLLKALDLFCSVKKLKKNISQNERVKMKKSKTKKLNTAQRQCRKSNILKQNVTKKKMTWRCLYCQLQLPRIDTDCVTAALILHFCKLSEIECGEPRSDHTCWWFIILTCDTRPNHLI